MRSGSDFDINLVNSPPIYCSVRQMNAVIEFTKRHLIMTANHCITNPTELNGTERPTFVYFDDGTVPPDIIARVRERHGTLVAITAFP